MELRPNCYLIGGKTCYIPNVSKFCVEKGYLSMLTALKVSSLTCKCPFYRPEYEIKKGPHEIEF